MSQPQAATNRLPFQFTGNAKEYFGIWIVNALLTVVTLGIYSAWAKVRSKRYIYGNTLLDNAPFDYMASPIAILKGWAIAVGIFVIYSVATKVYPDSALIFGLLFVLLLPWVIIRALAFRMKNTAYRNIRFSFNKDLAEAIKVFVMLAVLIPLTLGLIIPYYQFRQKKFVANNTGYGKSPFVLSAGAGGYYKIFLKAFGMVLVLGIISIGLFSLLPILMGVGVMEDAITSSPEMQMDPDLLQPANQMPGVSGMAVLFISLAMIPIYLGYMYAGVYIQTATTNYLWNNMSIDNNRFESTLKVSKMFWIYFTNMIAIFLSLGLLIPWAKIRTVRYRVENIALLSTGNISEVVASNQQDESAIGDEVGEAFDIDIGI